MVTWRSQADEIETLRTEIKRLDQTVVRLDRELEEMDELVERMAQSDTLAKMLPLLRKARVKAEPRQQDRVGQVVCLYRSPPKAPH
jgi:hypothetical protein